MGSGQSFLSWMWSLLAQSTVAAALLGLAAVLGRKWLEQVLQRSLLLGVEDRKADLAKSVEAYKVSLIAESEGAKARTELRKSIALRYAEIEFERLVTLEAALGTALIDILSHATAPVEHKTNEAVVTDMKLVDELRIAIKGVEMFVLPEQRGDLVQIGKRLVNVISQHVGAGVNTSPSDAEEREIMQLSNRALEWLRLQIRQLGDIDSARHPGR